MLEWSAISSSIMVVRKVWYPASSISMNWDLFKNANSQAHIRLIESETLEGWVIIL